jgi:hypothetical protein
VASYNQTVPPNKLTGGRALWGFIKDSLATEVRSMLRLLAAPVQALNAGSLDPIKVAFRRAEEDSARVFERYGLR